MTINKEKCTFEFFLFSRLLFFDESIDGAIIHGFEIKSFTEGGDFFTEELASNFYKFLFLFLSSLDEVTEDS